MRPENEFRAGFTLVEVLIAMGITLIVLTAVSTLLVSSVRSDGKSRSRTTVTSVLESWMERYRAGQEPLGGAGSVCTGNASETAFTCTYATGHDYSNDSIYEHQLSGATLNSRFQKYRSVITGTKLRDGVQDDLWQLTITVRDENLNQTMETITYVLQ